MKIIYRISPVKAKDTPFTDDKFTLVKTCLRSFVAGWSDVKPDMYFILDNCPPEYLKTIEKEVPFNKEVWQVGVQSNLGTYQMQLDMASGFDGPVVLQEDDYLYMPKVGAKIVSALDKYDFVTPQDEHYYYFEEPRHIGKYEIKIIADHHFREVNSTTLTFATNAKTIKENKGLMYEHGIADYPMWQDMRANGLKIGCPIPSFAAHLVKNILPPTIDWSKTWQKYL